MNIVFISIVCFFIVLAVMVGLKGGKKEEDEVTNYKFDVSEVDA